MYELQRKALESERFAIAILSDYIGVEPERIKHISADNDQSPFDLLFHSLKFDVKFASPGHDSTRKKQAVWTFDIRYKENYCDYLILVGMEDDQPTAVFVVPADVSPKRNLRVSIDGTSKWHRYRIWGKNFQPLYRGAGANGMQCKECGERLVGQHTVYCSEQCSKAAHMRLWKLRHPEKARESRRKHQDSHGSFSPLERDYLRAVMGDKCTRCGSTEELHIHHYKPPRFGGSSQCNNLTLFCERCHKLYHKFFDSDGFWDMTLSRSSEVLLTSRRRPR